MRQFIISSVLGASLHLRPQLQFTVGGGMSPSRPVFIRKRLRAQFAQGERRLELSPFSSALLTYLLKKAVRTFIIR